eukprot:scaffold151717_cov18-Tisochrysis_lutea.AAC.1
MLGTTGGIAATTHVSARKAELVTGGAVGTLGLAVGQFASGTAMVTVRCSSRFLCVFGETGEGATCCTAALFPACLVVLCSSLSVACPACSLPPLCTAKSQKLDLITGCIENAAAIIFASQPLVALAALAGNPCLRWGGWRA